jgi:hypothetical protein
VTCRIGERLTLALPYCKCPGKIDPLENPPRPCRLSNDLKSMVVAKSRLRSLTPDGQFSMREVAHYVNDRTYSPAL